MRNSMAWLRQMLEPVTAVMSLDFAETLVKLRADAVLLNRIEELNSCRHGRF